MTLRQEIGISCINCVAIYLRFDHDLSRPFICKKLMPEPRLVTNTLTLYTVYLMKQ
jgi:hypothetical protein